MAAAGLAVLAAVVDLAVGGSSSKQSAPSALPLGSQLHVAQCTPLKGPRWFFPGKIAAASRSYELFATGYPCSQAAEWTRGLIGRKLAHRAAGNGTPLDGVAGFTCFGYPDKNGLAYAGACRKAGTGVEFGWNINVLNRPVTNSLSPEDVGRSHTAGSDANTVIRMVGTGRYELDVNNTSTIGFINVFTWAPPPGMTVKAVTRSTGGRCHLAPDGTIACRGALRPPKCLCEYGGTLSVDFTASGGTTVTHVNGHPVISGGPVGGKLTIAAMTPIPYLIPSTPQGF